MITIKKSNYTMTIKDHRFAAIQDTSDGLYLKLVDGSELRINCDNASNVKVIATMLQNSKSANIIVDLDNTSKPISFS